MAQQRRRRKHRGTQAGTVRPLAARGRARARRRAATSEQRRQQRLNQPPTWRGAFDARRARRGEPLPAAGAPPERRRAEAIGLALLAAAIYMPAFHAIDSFVYRRRQRKREETS